MSITQPKVSIVVPLYNKAPFVVEALESVFSQTFRAHEIIVVDDGSTDDGVSRVQALGHSSIHLLRQANSGVAVARNTGIQAATGDFITFLDADDRYLPGYLACITSLASDFPQASLLCTAYRRFSDAEIGNRKISGPRLKIGRGLVTDFYSAWSRSSFFSTISVAIRTTAFVESGIRFPVGEHLGEDQDVWFQLAERFDIAFDPEVNSEYRIGVVGSATIDQQIIDILPCYRRLAARVARNEVPNSLMRGARRLLANHLLNVARSRYRAGDKQGAWQLVMDPMTRANPGYLIRTSLQMGISTFGLGVSK